MRFAKRSAFVVLLAAASPAAAATYVVTSFVDVPDMIVGDGLCRTATGICTLRAAIQETNSTVARDVVVLPAGTFVLTVPGVAEDQSATGDLDVRAPLELRGAGPSATIIDGGQLERVLDVHAPGGSNSVELKDLVIANGRATINAGGAGLRVATGATIAAFDVEVRDNAGLNAFGTGIGIDNGGCFTGTRVRIVRNTGTSSLAGGVATRGAASCFTLVDSEISDNVGDQAGAIYADSGAPVTLRRSLVAGNRARFAGAMLLNSGNEVLLEDTTVSGNRGSPGAVLVDGNATLHLRNCTVTLNGPAQSSAIVGAILDVHGGFGRTFVTNTILAGNGPGSQADECRVLQSEGGGNLIGDIAGCTANLLPTDVVAVDPELGPLADNGGATRTHLPGSPAVDAGVDDACTAADQRGVARPQDGDGDGVAHCDVGAVEIAGGFGFADGFE